MRSVAEYMTEDWPYKFFTQAEMRCKCGECDGLPEEAFMNRLEAIRSEYGEPMIISSGFRCAKYNAQVSSSGNDGAHVRGLAADIKVAGSEAYRLLDLAMTFGMTGIGISQAGNHDKRFLHLDMVPADDPEMPRPYVWSYV